MDHLFTIINITIFLVLSFFSTSCLPSHYICDFVKKVDAISYVESSEIENDEFEDNQELLKTINDLLEMRINSQSIQHTILGEELKAVINYSIIKKNFSEIIGISKKNNFVMYFDINNNELIFSEFHDAAHVTSYFYVCNKK